MTLGSLFDGIAGFPLAAERQGIKTVWISEIEANCIEIAKRHFPDAENLGDITEIDGGSIPAVDIISFGSPCQDLSVAGGQKGLTVPVPACLWKRCG
jgi:DNA (cytosine-5)-methyltransferase 1